MELSRQLRSKGNEAYTAGCTDALAPVVRSGRLLKASKFYRQALDASRSEDERAKCSKNLGAVHWRHARLCLDSASGSSSLVTERPPAYDVELSIEYYLAALRHSRQQCVEWRDNIKQSLEEITRCVVEDESAGLLDRPEFVANVNRVFGAAISSGGKSQAWAIFQLGLAQHLFDRAVKELRSKDSEGARNYRQSLALLHSCHRPIEEAERRASRVDFLDEIARLKESVDACRVTCESIQASAAGKRILHESKSMKNRDMSHDMVIGALDKFKEAAVIARGVDAECEAEALANVGDVYRDIFKKDQQAHPYYSVAVLLAQNSDAMLSAKWYQKAKVALNIFFKKKKEEVETDNIEALRLRQERERLEAKCEKLSTEDFLKYVYAEYPARVPNGSCGSPRNLATPVNTRIALRKAIQLYHPDHNATVDDPRWTASCGEITRLLLEKHSVINK